MFVENKEKKTKPTRAKSTDRICTFQHRGETNREKGGKRQLKSCTLSVNNNLQSQQLEREREKDEMLLWLLVVLLVAFMLDFTKRKAETGPAIRAQPNKITFKGNSKSVHNQTSFPLFALFLRPLIESCKPCHEKPTRKER